jgi:hypothetical protein
MEDPQIDNDLIDEAVLALMFLTLHDERGFPSISRAWKSFDWEAMGRLHAKELILNPVGKARSVILTEEGRKRSEAAFYRLFVRKDVSQTPAGR